MADNNSNVSGQAGSPAQANASASAAQVTPESITLSFSSLRESEQSRTAHLSMYRWDPTDVGNHDFGIPSTDPQRQVWVRLIVAAMASTNEAKDGANKVGQWRKIFIDGQGQQKIAGMKQLEQGAWLILGRLEAYHRDGGPQYVANVPEHLRDMQSWRQRFNDHANAVIKILRERKTACFRTTGKLEDVEYLVENPGYVERRIDKNRANNESRQTRVKGNEEAAKKLESMKGSKRKREDSLEEADEEQVPAPSSHESPADTAEPSSLTSPPHSDAAPPTKVPKTKVSEAAGPRVRRAKKVATSEVVQAAQVDPLGEAPSSPQGQEHGRLNAFSSGAHTGRAHTGISSRHLTGEIRYPTPPIGPAPAVSRGPHSNPHHGQLNMWIPHQEQEVHFTTMAEHQQRFASQYNPSLLPHVPGMNLVDIYGEEPEDHGIVRGQKGDEGNHSGSDAALTSATRRGFRRDRMVMAGREVPVDPSLLEAGK